jgi:hypothetical protein
MPIDVERPRWRPLHIAKSAGISDRLFASWREKFGLFPGRMGSTLSIVDTAVVVAICAQREASARN